MVDPKNPGIIDEIINLGNYWNQTKLLESKERIILLSNRASRLYKIAYSNLKEAKVARDEWASYYSTSIDLAKINEITYKLKNKIFKDVVPQFIKYPTLRQGFASANTPEGLVHFFDSILQDVHKVIAIKGDPGTGKGKVMEALLNGGISLGLDGEGYYCPLNHDKLELIYWPALSTAVLRINEYLKYSPGYLPNIKVFEEINFNKFVNADKIDLYKDEIANAKERFAENHKRALQKLAQVKATRTELEKCYVKAMDFNTINDKRDELYKRILSYGENI